MIINLIPKAHYDVAVIGGGSAGVFAAHGAAASGSKTLLVEKTGILGGTAVNAYVDYPGIFNYWGKQFITGPSWNLFERLGNRGAAILPANEYSPRPFSKQQIKINPFMFATECERLCLSVGVEILMHTMVSHVLEDECVTLALTGKEGIYAVTADVVIDCTGDANICGMLGYERVRSDVLQPATYANRLNGYKIEDVSEEEVNAVFDKAIADGYLDSHLFSWKSPYKMLQRYKIDMHIACPGAESSKDKTALELEGHEVLARMVELFRKVKGCEKLRVAVFSAECGIRETCRIVGETEITVDKYLSGYVYPDAVCYAFYPVDAHTLTGIKNLYFEDGVCGTIPYGSMIPKGAKRILAAGRIASADSDTNSAIRVQSPCYAMGTAAGVAASLAVKHSCGVKSVPYGELVECLKALGCTVPGRE